MKAEVEAGGRHEWAEVGAGVGPRAVYSEHRVNYVHRVNARGDGGNEHRPDTAESASPLGCWLEDEFPFLGSVLPDTGRYGERYGEIFRF